MSPPVRNRVSILIPAYNCARTIGETIDCCLAQTYEDVEIVVVNDGSTEEALPRVLRSYGERIRVIEQPNGGVGAARNTLVEAATGEFVAWIDGDDLSPPERIGMQVAVMQAYPDLVFVSSEFSSFDDEGREWPAPDSHHYYAAVKRFGGMRRIYPGTRPMPGGDGEVVRVGDIYDKVLWGNVVHFGTGMGRLATFREVGPFDASLRYATEWEIVVRLARLGPFGFLDAPLLRYRRSTAQLSYNSSGGLGHLEKVRVLRDIAARDPELYARERGAFETWIGRSYVAAADVLGQTEPAHAVGLLAKALAHRPEPGPWMRALAKAALPRPAVEAVRRMKRRLEPAGPQFPY